MQLSETVRLIGMGIFITLGAMILALCGVTAWPHPISFFFGGISIGLSIGLILTGMMVTVIGPQYLITITLLLPTSIYGSIQGYKFCKRFAEAYSQ